MALSPGARLGPYEILAAIGAGGMGEVYRARDATLNRDVALKILPEAFARDPERLARFTREAQTLAALNHPHIAHIHGLEESGGVRALVMELVEGRDLSELIAGQRRSALAPINIDDALPIARQVADALVYAHEQGIIHRDLKPANIKVRPDGTVKVLDFGLAKALDPLALSPAAAALANSPTLSSPAALTVAGTILGTAAYMSPEQARGKAVDKRADIWAFGCVLYELLTGSRAFEGDEVSDTLAFVITKDPDWAVLPPNTPAPIRRLLRRCLEKDRKRRLADIADARLEIDDALTTPVADRIATGPANLDHPATGAVGWRRALPRCVAIASVAAMGAMLVVWAPWQRVPLAASWSLSAELGADASLIADPGAAVALSPDGAVLAFVARQTGGKPQVYVRHLDQLQAMPLQGTEGAITPFFSPEGRWIAFFADAKLKKIAVTGGAVVTICDAPYARGGTWAEDNTIVLAATGNVERARLLRVSSVDGKAEAVTTLGEGETTQRWPQVLPGGKAVLYTAHSQPRQFDDANLVVQALPAGARTIVQRGAYFGRYLPSGHLVYIHDDTFFARPFDLNRLEPIGPPVPFSEGVAAIPRSGGAQFDVAGNGTLVYLPAQSDSAGAPIDWMDHEGKTTPLRPTPARWSSPRFSPNGNWLALQIEDKKQGDADIWVYSVARGTPTRLTTDPARDTRPVWTADSNRIVFGSARGGTRVPNLYWQRVDANTNEAQPLTKSTNSQYPASWDPQGKLLAFEEWNPQTNSDLMILPVAGDEASGWKIGTPTVFLNTLSAERRPMFSPHDGRWIAYVSNESGNDEVYVRPYPGPGGKTKVSIDGGEAPNWSPVRNEIFYVQGGQIMVAAYTVKGDTFSPAKARVWSPGPVRVPTRRGVALHPDGERFAVEGFAETPTDAWLDKVVFIFNFFDELRRIAPAAKR